jgi:hypothetical protein
MPDNGKAIQPAEEADIEGSSGLAIWRSRARSLADEFRSDPARWGSFLLVAVASAAFAAWLLNLGRQQWFVTDEFDYFNSGHEPLITWLLRPHNEHTIAFTKAWFGSMSDFVGLRHYGLYMIPLVTAHLVVVAAIYRLTWISTGSRVIATGTALVSLAMGAAAGTLTWAGQFQYVGSVAAGLIVILLAVQSSTRRAVAVAIALTVFGTLNGTAFVAFGLAASIVYARRRLWGEAILVAAIPIGWELASRFVWAPQDPYAAHELGQILREGPAVAYSVLDTAISQTLGETHLSSAVLTALVLGTLALISVNIRSRRTALSGRVVVALAMVAILTMLSLLVARLALGTELSSGGGYSYLFLVALLPVGGILLGHMARSKAALLGAAGVFLTISLMGVNTISDKAASLQSWKINGAHLMQTAAAELNAGMPTFPDQVPVPDTAPTVSQEQLRSLVASGQLDAVIAVPVEADQVSLNMQWRLASAGQTAGVCRDLAAGEGFAVPVGASVSILGLSPGAAVDLRYASSIAARQFEVPTTVASLQTLSQRTAAVTVEAASVRVCLPSWE